MSDTPKTDKAEKLALELTKELTWDCVVAGEAGIRQIARACRESERENAALREQVEQMRYIIKEMADRFGRPEYKTGLFDDFMRMMRDLRRERAARKEAQS